MPPSPSFPGACNRARRHACMVVAAPLQTRLNDHRQQRTRRRRRTEAARTELLGPVRTRRGGRSIGRTIGGVLRNRWRYSAAAHPGSRADATHTRRRSAPAPPRGRPPAPGSRRLASTGAPARRPSVAGPSWASSTSSCALAVGRQGSRPAWALATLPGVLEGPQHGFPAAARLVVRSAAKGHVSGHGAPLSEVSRPLERFTIGGAQLALSLRERRPLSRSERATRREAL